MSTHFFVGLIGTIASGKSTVANYFQSLGIDVISADVISRALCEKDTPVFQQIVTHFGCSIINNHGELDRHQLRQLIFNHPQERLWLEALLHPLIRVKIKESIAKMTSIYGVIEIPLIPNKAHYPYLNRILCVTSSQETQIKRLTARDNCSRKDALAILKSQASEASYIALADDVLRNTDTTTISTLSEQVQLLHQQYSHYASAG